MCAGSAQPIRRLLHLYDAVDQSCNEGDSNNRKSHSGFLHWLWGCNAVGQMWEMYFHSYLLWL